MLMQIACILYLIFSCYSYSINESLHRCLAKTELSGVCSLRVVGVHPYIRVRLQLFDRSVDFLSERNSIEFVLDGSIESLTNTVCLRTFSLDFGMIHVFYGRIKFVLVSFPVSAIFSSSVREHTHKFQIVLFEKRNNPIIKHIGGNKCVLAIIQLCEPNLGIGIDDGLPVDMTYAFDIVLTPK